MQRCRDCRRPTETGQPAYSSSSSRTTTPILAEPDHAAFDAGHHVGADEMRSAHQRFLMRDPGATAIRAVHRADRDAIGINELGIWLDLGTVIQTSGEPLDELLEQYGAELERLGYSVGTIGIQVGGQVGPWQGARHDDVALSLPRLSFPRQDLALEAAITKLDRYDLLVLDDLSYVRRDQAETSVLFELISRRYECRSLLINANQPFAAWNSVFPDPAMTVAAIDRLVHYAVVVEMNVEATASAPQPPLARAALRPRGRRTRSRRC